MTKSVDGELGENKYFSSPNTAITAYEYGVVSLRAKIKVLSTENIKYKKFGGNFLTPLLVNFFLIVFCQMIFLM